MINQETSLRYLGLIFDQTLSRREHISRLVVKARKGHYVVKLMACDGMPQRILCLLFYMLVLSLIHRWKDWMSFKVKEWEPSWVAQKILQQLQWDMRLDILPAMHEMHKLASRPTSRCVKTQRILAWQGLRSGENETEVGNWVDDTGSMDHRGLWFNHRSNP